MAHNIEIKAKINSVEAMEPLVAMLADSRREVIYQGDVFFHCLTGRLKLRIFSKTAGELIFYQREDKTGPASSFYVRTPTADPTSLHEALTLAYGEIGQVVKERTLYMIGRTRIHLDRVKGLGDFIELEVVLEDDELPESGIAEAKRLMTDLGIASSSLVASAYIDLINAKTDKG